MKQRDHRMSSRGGELTLWETVQQKAAAWVDRLAEQDPAKDNASAVSRADTAWEQTVSQPPERAYPAEERGQREPTPPAHQGGGDTPQEREGETDGRTPVAPAAPRRSVEEVARDERVAQRVGRIQDAARRAEAERLLRTIREEAAAREESTRRTQMVELEH